MNTYYINDQNFINSEIYQNFLNNNPQRGTLSIRAYAANEAVPIEGVNISISSNIDDNKIIFYEGTTDSSGTITGIVLPASTLNLDNLSAPNKTEYNIQAVYKNIARNYKINMYENVSVIQNISIVPEMGDISGS